MKTGENALRNPSSKTDHNVAAAITSMVRQQSLRPFGLVRRIQADNECGGSSWRVWFAVANRSTPCEAFTRAASSARNAELRGYWLPPLLVTLSCDWR